MKTSRATGSSRPERQRRSAFVYTLFFAFPSVCTARVELNVTRVGFPTIRTGQVTRQSTWTPVVVDLALVNQAAFDGVVRTAQFDLDGDECFDSVDVHLRAETGGVQRVTLYVPTGPPRQERRFFVELLTTEGEAVEVVSQGALTYRAMPAERAHVIVDDDVLILSIGSGAIGRVKDLTDTNLRLVLIRPVHVAHLSTSDLPDLSIGLEAVDYVIWDDARPEDLNPQQRDALLAWVRHGGTLLVAASRTAPSFALSEAFERILPVTLREVDAVDNLPHVRETLVGRPPADVEARVSERVEKAAWFEQPFPTPVPVVQTAARQGARRVGGIESDVITRWPVDRGAVIFSAVAIKDLFSAPGDATHFFRTVFHLRAVQRDEDSPEPDPTPHSLFPHVVSAVSFSTSASFYLLAAFTFSIGYVLLATGGVWWFLGRRNWRQHSWSAFAATAAAASLLSVLFVGLRGLGETLHQLTVVDFDAGDAFGSGRAYFGLKTGTDKELDVWLPSDPLRADEPEATSGFLRPLPVGGYLAEASASSFADPESYRLMPGSALIEGVRMRATLKRFEGRWEGPLRGTLTGRITILGNRITDDSFVVNELDAELRDCLLLQAAADPGETEGDRSGQIYVFPLGTLPAGREKVMLTERCYKPQRDETFSQLLLRSTLAKAQKEWSAPFRGVLSNLGYGLGGSEAAAALGEGQKALLLASTVGELDPRSLSGVVQNMFGLVTWSRDRLRVLDLREDLWTDSVMLIGFSDDPGPVRLFARSGKRDFERVEPDPRHSWAMYRIRIPATVVQSKAPGEDEQ